MDSKSTDTSYYLNLVLNSNAETNDRVRSANLLRKHEIDAKGVEMLWGLYENQSTPLKLKEMLMHILMKSRITRDRVINMLKLPYPDAISREDLGYIAETITYTNRTERARDPEIPVILKKLCTYLPLLSQHHKTLSEVLIGISSFMRACLDVDENDFFLDLPARGEKYPSLGRKVREMFRDEKATILKAIDQLEHDYPPSITQLKAFLREEVLGIKDKEWMFQEYGKPTFTLEEEGEMAKELRAQGFTPTGLIESFFVDDNAQLVVVGFSYDESKTVGKIISILAKTRCLTHVALPIWEGHKAPVEKVMSGEEISKKEDDLLSNGMDHEERIKRNDLMVRLREAGIQLVMTGSPPHLDPLGELSVEHNAKILKNLVNSNRNLKIVFLNPAKSGRANYGGTKAERHDGGTRSIAYELSILEQKLKSIRLFREFDSFSDEGRNDEAGVFFERYGFPQSFGFKIAGTPLAGKLYESNSTWGENFDGGIVIKEDDDGDEWMQKDEPDPSERVPKGSPSLISV